jgi:hypothetical protein
MHTLQLERSTTETPLTTDGSTRGASCTATDCMLDAPRFTRMCNGTCGQPIPEKRLAVMPRATMCVPCQEARGDVPVIKKFTDHVGDNEEIETYFTSGTSSLERYIRYTNTRIAGEESFDVARGDDSHLTVEINTALAIARPLASAFEADDEAQRERHAKATRVTTLKDGRTIYRHANGETFAYRPALAAA